MMTVSLTGTGEGSVDSMIDAVKALDQWIYIQAKELYMQLFFVSTAVSTHNCKIFVCFTGSNQQWIAI